MIGPEHESVRPGEGAGFGDAVTFAWGAAAAELYGTARVGLSGGTSASVLALLFRGPEAVASSLEGGFEVADPDWTSLEAGGVRVEIVEPLRAWRVVWDGD